MTYFVRWGLFDLDTSSDISYIFAIGGAPVPLFETPDDYNTFLIANGSTLENATTGTGFGPSEDIPLSGLAGIAGLGELDISPFIEVQLTSASEEYQGDDGGKLIRAAQGDDFIFGGDGDDILLGERGRDQLLGEGGNDSIEGGKFDDNLQGGDGTDTLRGGAGADSISGDDDNDRITGGQGFDTLSGGEGNDTISGENGGDDLFGGEGNDRLFGGRKADNLSGSDGNDTLLGQQGDDFLSGGEDDDEIFGDQGRDTLIGGEGADTLDGGSWDDTLDGDSGNDVFIFDVGYGRDLIEDFEDDIDTIRLGADLGNGLLGMTGQEIIDTYVVPQASPSTERVILDFGTEELTFFLRFSFRDQLADDIEVF